MPGLSELGVHQQLTCGEGPLVCAPRPGILEWGGLP